MGSHIEWTDETWNPTVGCERVSPGCDGCYAIGVAHRAMQPAHEGLTIKRPGERLDWTGEVRMLPARLDAPLRWRKPRRVFVDSMSDLFHPDVLAAEHELQPFLAHVFAVMAAAKHHTFQVLTKRPQVMAAVLAHPRFRLDVNSIMVARGYPVMPGGMTDPTFQWPRNIWLGTSIESDRYTFRSDHLRTIDAVRFLSLEPLLGPLPSLNLRGIDWVIAGGESGPGARPMHPDWVRDIRERCTARSIPFFFKQWGEWQDGGSARLTNERVVLTNGRALTWQEYRTEFSQTPSRENPTVMTRVGKRIAGRDLDGRTWDEYPATTLAQ